ncbi:MAG: hypothetical protein ACI9JN_001263 [Bacteroidia bacterium]|jgi:hypothetical protein
MIVTSEQIKVTYEMMVKANMTRGLQFGIPVNPSDPNKGLHWKNLAQMEDSDFDKIEKYFIEKQKR